MELGNQPRNINYSAKKGIMTITVDLTKDGVPSKSGKSNVIASTYGNVYVADLGVTMGINIYRKVGETAPASK